MTTQEQTLSRLRTLKLASMASAYDLQMEQIEIHRLGFDERLSLLVEAEISARENRHLKRMLKTAALPEPAAIEEIDWNAGRGLDREQVASLSNCDWIRRQQNVVIVGKTGVGKTWLGAALVNQACRNRIRAKWYRSSDLIEEIAEATSDGSLPKLKQLLARPTLLALDDFGLGVFDTVASSVLLDVVDRRLRSGGALLITSQFETKEWHSLFPDPTVADAILDRIVHQSHVLALKGESMRKERAKSRLKSMS